MGHFWNIQQMEMGNVLADHLSLVRPPNTGNVGYCSEVCGGLWGSCEELGGTFADG